MSSFELNFISENNNNNNNINVNGLSNTTINVEENIGNMGTSSVSQGGLTNRFSKWVNFPLEEEEEDEEALPLLLVLSSTKNLQNKLITYFLKRRIGYQYLGDVA